MKDYSNVNDDRVILLLDMDCFEVQVHQDPSMIGKPRVVANSKDRILAVSYEAKKEYGITRDSTPYVSAAVARCPHLIIIPVPTRSNGRPDTRVAKEATEKIMDSIRHALSQRRMREVRDYVFQFSSGDEFFIDLSPYIHAGQGRKRLDDGDFLTHASENLFDRGSLIYLYSDGTQGEPRIGPMRQKLRELALMEVSGVIWPDPRRMQERRLIFGAYIAASMVGALYNETGFISSVGVGSNKLVAKIAGGQHKPGSITIVSPLGFRNFIDQVHLGDVPGLGGGLGMLMMREWGRDRMGDFRRVTYDQLSACIHQNRENYSWSKAEGKAAEVLEKLDGLCDDPVVTVDCFDTVSSTFKFRGHHRYFTQSNLKRYVYNEVFDEFAEKLQFEARWHRRVATRVKLTISLDDGDNMTVIS